MTEDQEHQLFGKLDYISGQLAGLGLLLRAIAQTHISQNPAGWESLQDITKPAPDADIGFRKGYDSIVS